jgi:hypothetical protein
MISPIALSIKNRPTSMKNRLTSMKNPPLYNRTGIQPLIEPKENRRKKPSSTLRVSAAFFSDFFFPERRNDEFHR